MALTVDKGIVTGRDHVVYGLNCQDSLVAHEIEINGQKFIFGFIADGCGEFRKNETGAHLTTSFLTVRTIDLLKKGVPLAEIPDKLYEYLVSFFEHIINCYVTDDASYPLVMAVVKEHLLATALGYIIGPEDTVVFCAGDGVVVLNDMIDVREENNKPPYPAYQSVNEKYLERPRSQLKRGFDVYTEKTVNVKRLAIGSDAWKFELATLLEFLSDRKPVSIQRAMNVLSERHKKFKDDASLILVFQVEEGDSDESTTE